MSSPKKNEGKGFFASMSSGFSMFGNAMHRSVNGLLGYEGVEVINPEGGKEDAEEEAQRGRWKQEDRDSYWKMMHKYIGSDVTSMVTLPVLIFEPMTMLQKMAELMEYSYLLDQADECEDPYLRLVYASSWAISVYYAYQRTWKPFNPILGETYEMSNHGGITFISEQVSHHPPMSAGHAENEHFTYDVTSKLNTKFLGNSLDVYPVGRTRVTLKKDGVVLDLVPPPTKVNNLIFGRTWVDSPGEMIMTNLTTGDKVVLYFQPCGWFGAGRYEVDGYVYNAAEEPKILITGKWNESLSYQPCDIEGEPLPGTELKELWHVADIPENDKFQYTHFAHKINSFDTAPRKLLASDSRLRPDRYALERGDLSKAGAEKSSLEERQRAEKRNREAKGHKRLKLSYKMAKKLEINNMLRSSDGDTRNNLIYVEESPNYCFPNQSFGSMGTLGRHCEDEQLCDELCIKCGYNITEQLEKTVNNCNCKFNWCCNVKCETCPPKTISICSKIND